MSSEHEKQINKLRVAFNDYQTLKHKISGKREASQFFFISGFAGCLIALCIYLCGSPMEKKIINVARKYGFEIVADENKRKEGTSGFSEKIIAEEKSSSGCVFFCTNGICIEEGYFFFPPDAFYHKKYSDFSSEAQIRSWLSPELSGSLLDRTVKALKEIRWHE